MKTYLKRFAWAAGAMCVTVACKDVPLLPQWDAQWNVPLPSQALLVPTGTIPSGFPPQNVSFPTQSDTLNASVGAILQNAADTGGVQLTLTKQASLALNGSFTLYIAGDSTKFVSGPSIAIPVTVGATATTVTLTASANLGLIRTIADANGVMYLKLSGTVSNPGPGSVVVTPANDTIKVRLAALPLIHVSR